MIKHFRGQRKLATALCLLIIPLLPLMHLLRGKGTAEAAQPGLMPVLAPAARQAPLHLPTLRSAFERQNGSFVQALSDGRSAELTLDARAQETARRILERQGLPYAAIAMISVDDGRVLALWGRSRREPELNGPGLALTAWAPAASVFKLVTAAALVSSGVPGATRVCYHDGIHSFERSNLTPHARWDTACQSLAFGVAKSNNAIVGRLANDRLTPAMLDVTARALGFGSELPFELTVAPSTAAIPEDSGLSFARVAAGFWQTTMSPLHGAYLAATIARGGQTPPLHLVERIVDGNGNVTLPEPAAPTRALSEATAREVGRMMVGTTQYGTARLGFHDRKSNRPLLPFSVAGKTGTLNRRDPAQPFLGYSWFVGFAPAERPEVAFAVLLGNGDGTSLRAHQIARELLTAHFLGDTPVVAGPRIASR